ncbi:hypothetical protein BpHYR1_031707 [Brachionus plicatilis]|uniref:Uncharacterized protein n=1 Tax=Brachionus plicatilis TaxID=10195 RepID=A0A3M7QP67_BRAPC|nr:hypothetical protein BpHYR1_031707 [Brachionus plicatilis]
MRNRRERKLVLAALCQQMHRLSLTFVQDQQAKVDNLQKFCGPSVLLGISFVLFLVVCSQFVIFFTWCISAVQNVICIYQLVILDKKNTYKHKHNGFENKICLICFYYYKNK